jgi:hypothetical protein
MQANPLSQSKSMSHFEELRAKQREEHLQFHRKLILGSILQNSVSAENFSDNFLASNFVQISTQKKLFIYLSEYS